jgi:hypothetical protein
MPGNYTPKDGFAEFQTTPQREMWAFDALPVTLRRAVDDAPYSMSSEVVLAMHVKDGWQKTLKAIQRDSATFAGEEAWTPMTTSNGLASSRVGRRASAIPGAASGRRNLRRSDLTTWTVAEYSSGASR